MTRRLPHTLVFLCAGGPLIYNNDWGDKVSWIIGQ
jgi:hypothetical protein